MDPLPIIYGGAALFIAVIFVFGLLVLHKQRRKAEQLRRDTEDHDPFSEQRAKLVRKTQKCTPPPDYATVTGKKSQPNKKRIVVIPTPTRQQMGTFTTQYVTLPPNAHDVSDYVPKKSHVASAPVDEEDHEVENEDETTRLLQPRDSRPSRSYSAYSPTPSCNSNASTLKAGNDVEEDLELEVLVAEQEEEAVKTVVPGNHPETFEGHADMQPERNENPDEREEEQQPGYLNESDAHIIVISGPLDEMH